MKHYPKIIRRGKITYVLYQESVVVGFGFNQWVSYNQYNNWNRQGITQFKHAIMKSREDEYGTPSDQLTLAHQCGIRGSGAAKPKEIE